MQEQQEKTFAKRLENDQKKAETSLRKLRAREFACEPDAGRRYLTMEKECSGKETGLRKITEDLRRYPTILR